MTFELLTGSLFCLLTCPDALCNLADRRNRLLAPLSDVSQPFTSHTCTIRAVPCRSHMPRQNFDKRWRRRSGVLCQATYRTNYLICSFGLTYTPLGRWSSEHEVTVALPYCMSQDKRHWLTLLKRGAEGSFAPESVIFDTGRLCALSNSLGIL